MEYVGQRVPGWNQLENEGENNKVEIDGKEFMKKIGLELEEEDRQM